MEAIKLFHGEVSEDLLLKEKQFEGLRTKLLRGAADFYGKLEGSAEGPDGPASRAALGRAYYELGELTDKIGNKPEALAVHRKALAVRRELAQRPGADAEAVLDVVRSLTQRLSLHASVDRGRDRSRRRSRRPSSWPRDWSPRAAGPTRPRSVLAESLMACGLHVTNRRENLEMARPWAGDRAGARREAPRGDQIPGDSRYASGQYRLRSQGLGPAGRSPSGR